MNREGVVNTIKNMNGSVRIDGRVMNRNPHSAVSHSAFALLLGMLMLSSGCFVFTKEYWTDPPEFPKSSELKSLGKVDGGWTFFTLDGIETSFRDFEGKAMFLIVWATGCGSCQSELPGVQRLYDSMKDTGVAFLLLSEEDGGTVQEFIETQGYTFPAYVYEGKLPDVLRTDTLPTTYIIDRQGGIVFSHAGTARWDDPSCKHFLYHVVQ
jgi:peroxiredoxin